MRIEVDIDLCQNYGQCVFEAPDFFELPEDGRLRHATAGDADARDVLEAAADACPVQAITLHED